ncbi:MAG: helix-hairpin-helix domain-containing protein [Clostridium sp.]
MGITSRGKRWEFLNSLWIIWSFIFGLNGVGLIIAGRKVKVRKWFISGLSYTAILSICFYIIGEAHLDSMISETGTSIFMGTMLIAIIHSFIIRKEYLMRLEIMIDNKTNQKVTSQLRKKISSEYGYSSNTEEKSLVSEANINEDNKLIVNKDEKPIITVDFDDVKVNSIEKLIDVNKCTEKELLKLPGVGIIEAKKVISHRSRSVFLSIDEFMNILGVKPHFDIRIREMITCETIEPDKCSTLNNNSTSYSGRMVDF